MNCKHCDIPMALKEATNRFLCETCQHSEPAVPVQPPSSNTDIEHAGKISEFQCVTCENTPLQVGRIARTEVCFCGDCGGFAIDRSSLGELVETLRGRFEGPDSPPVALDADRLELQLGCLACQYPLQMLQYNGPGNVVIGTCETCKISWLTQSQLDRIVRASGQRCYEFKLPEYTVQNSILGYSKLVHYG